ncbi:MAG TPA: hypothetical protein VEB21_07205 [Terriglobales bacterium]|nr:hypothetical protein [Terriglobales bacterium]
MRCRNLLLIASIAIAATACDSSSDDDSDAEITFRGPITTGTVTNFAFAVEVEIDAQLFDATTLELRLNDERLDLSGGPSTFTAMVQPGPPLRDDNVVEAVVTRTGGSGRVSERQGFRYLPPKARASRIRSEDQLIRGPLAHGRVGDYLLENGEARFIIQDAAKRDLYSVGTFGGNLIDAELVSRPGTDNFLEIQPAINIETVINAQTIEIVNDGEDGTAAIIRTCGPDDIIDFINPSELIATAGLTFPASADDVDSEVEGCTEYRLSPEKRYLDLTTTIFNNEPEARGFYVGDYINGSGELDQFTTLGAGIGEILTNRLSALSYIGTGEAEGVDYSLVLLPAAQSDRSSFFTTSGVSYILRNQLVVNLVTSGEPPNFVVPAGGSRSFTRFFGVGDGSMANAIDIEHEVTGANTATIRGCITAGGVPLPQARVSVGRGAADIRQLASQFTTGSDGCYAGTLRPGNYLVAAGKRGYLYEGGGTIPIFHEHDLVAGQTVVQNIDLPPTGRVRVEVTGPGDRPLPARISIVGFDPSPEFVITFSSPIGQTRSGLFYDVTKDPVPFGFAWLEYADAAGIAELEMEPGDYVVAVSRGTEYSLFLQRITVAAGQTAQVQASLAPVIDSTGFISSDFHVHGIHSADSRVSHRNRIFQFAGEGIDNLIMTDHEAHTDLRPHIEALGFENFLHTTTGEEITTGDYGHFNAYPFAVDDDRPSGGSTDWAVAAPPGEGFVSSGSYNATPAEIAALALDNPVSRASTTIQINHIETHFVPLKIDTSLVPPQSFVTAEEKLRLRLDPTTTNLFHHFPALEVWNGASRSKQLDEFIRLRLGIWFNHLNQGLLTTGIADTDTHEFTTLNAAGARTWTASPTDDPRRVDSDDVAAAVDAGRAIGGQGPFIETRLTAADGSGRFADLTLDGETLVRSDNRDVQLQIRVQSPAWAEFDTIEVYANANTTPTSFNGEIAVGFTSTPTLVLRAGTDFTIQRLNVFPEIAGAERLEANVSVSFDDLSEDTWFVAIVRGSDGISRPLFPVMVSDLDTASNTTLDDLVDGNLGESGVMSLGYTNALYADVDGVAGFQAPLAP